MKSWNLMWESFFFFVVHCGSCCYYLSCIIVCVICLFILMMTNLYLQLEQTKPHTHTHRETPCDQFHCIGFVFITVQYRSLIKLQTVKDQNNNKRKQRRGSSKCVNNKKVFCSQKYARTKTVRERERKKRLFCVVGRFYSSQRSWFGCVCVGIR